MAKLITGRYVVFHTGLKGYRSTRFDKLWVARLFRFLKNGSLYEASVWTGLKLIKKGKILKEVQEWLN